MSSEEDLPKKSKLSKRMAQMENKFDRFMDSMDQRNPSPQPIYPPQHQQNDNSKRYTFITDSGIEIEASGQQILSHERYLKNLEMKEKTRGNNGNNGHNDYDKVLQLTQELQAERVNNKFEGIMGHVLGLEKKLDSQVNSNIDLLEKRNVVDGDRDKRYFYYDKVGNAVDSAQSKGGQLFDMVVEEMKNDKLKKEQEEGWNRPEIVQEPNYPPRNAQGVRQPLPPTNNNYPQSEEEMEIAQELGVEPENNYPDSYQTPPDRDLAEIQARDQRRGKKPKTEYSQYFNPEIMGGSKS